MRRSTRSAATASARASHRSRSATSSRVCGLDQRPAQKHSVALVQHEHLFWCARRTAEIRGPTLPADQQCSDAPQDVVSVHHSKVQLGNMIQKALGASLAIISTVLAPRSASAQVSKSGMSCRSLLRLSKSTVITGFFADLPVSTGFFRHL